MPMRKFAWFSRYSMPNTESNLPTLIASSALLIGAMRPNACSRNRRVSSPVPSRRGTSCTRVNTITGSSGDV